MLPGRGGGSVGIERQMAKQVRWRILGGVLAWLAASAAFAQDTTRQSRDDAWWTGPMLANSAETLPPGHILVEPYVYDVMTDHNDGFGSRAYVLYGLTDNLTVGAIPIIGYNGAHHAPNSSG